MSDPWNPKTDEQRIFELEEEFTRLREELHQARAEWSEEAKRAREAETEVTRLREALTVIRDTGPQSYDWYRRRASSALRRTA